MPPKSQTTKSSGRVPTAVSTLPSSVDGLIRRYKPLGVFGARHTFLEGVGLATTEGCRLVNGTIKWFSVSLLETDLQTKFAASGSTKGPKPSSVSPPKEGSVQDGGSGSKNQTPFQTKSGKDQPLGPESKTQAPAFRPVSPGLTFSEVTKTGSRQWSEIVDEEESERKASSSKVPEVGSSSNVSRTRSRSPTKTPSKRGKSARGPTPPPADFAKRSLDRFATPFSELQELPTAERDLAMKILTLSQKEYNRFLADKPKVYQQETAFVRSAIDAKRRSSERAREVQQGPEAASGAPADAQVKDLDHEGAGDTSQEA
jgi:hypothetical protein